MSKIVIDTNIFVYAIDEDSKFFTKSQNFLLDTKYEQFTTSKNISEFLAVVTRGKFPIQIKDALSVVNDIKSSMNVLFPTLSSFSIFEELLSKYEPVGLKIHDFEIASIGLGNQISQVATFNRKDFVEIKEINLISLS
ncbi:MAG: type II toxin-antitoxin system VapC family toxin [Cytophagales bacterium]|nr:type II toxin-antitoxin system VapC family toxin [Cytophagales bacterium]